MLQAASSVPTVAMAAIVAIVAAVPLVPAAVPMAIVMIAEQPIRVAVRAVVVLAAARWQGSVDSAI
jgi:hypothetical protein